MKGDAAESLVLWLHTRGEWTGNKHSYPQTPAEQAKEEATFKEGLRALSERERSMFWGGGGGLVARRVKSFVIALCRVSAEKRCDWRERRRVGAKARIGLLSKREL